MDGLKRLYVEPRSLLLLFTCFCYVPASFSKAIFPENPAIHRKSIETLPDFCYTVLVCDGLGVLPEICPPVRQFSAVQAVFFVHFSCFFLIYVKIYVKLFPLRFSPSAQPPSFPAPHSRISPRGPNVHRSSRRPHISPIVP